MAKVKELKRITPEEVVDAYQKTNLSVAQGDYFGDELTCACGLGAIYAAVHDNEISVNEHIVSTYIDNMYSTSYRKGFANGFDGNLVTGLLDHLGKAIDYEQFKTGYEDGLEAYKKAIQVIQ